MRVFVAKSFARFADREGIGDSELREAVERANRGLIDADLGGGVIKQRIARRGEGRSGGYRSIILFLKGARAFFVFGFAKKDRGNITTKELQAFRLLSREMFSMGDADLDTAKRKGVLMEIEADGQEVS